MKKRKWSAVVIAILLFGLGVGAVQADSSSITVKNNTISNGKITATLANASYENGWLIGKVAFEDPFFTEYAVAHPDIDSIMNYFSDYYILTYAASGMSEVLPTPGGGYVLNDDGSGYYYEKFKRYVGLENESLEVQIYVYGIAEPFELKLSD